MSQTQKVVMVLYVLVFVNAIAVIYVKQQSRDLYSDIRLLQKQQDQLTIQWSRLQLQYSTLVNHAYVERIARQKLNMQTVKSPQYMVLQ